MRNRTSIELSDDKYGELSELVKEKGIFKVTIRDFDTTTEEMILEVILRSSGNKPYIIKNIKIECYKAIQQCVIFETFCMNFDRI